MESILTLFVTGLFVFHSHFSPSSSKKRPVLALPVLWLKKKISLDEPGILTYKSKLLEPAQETLATSKTRKFPWEEYLRLKHIQDHGGHLTIKDIGRLLELEVQYQYTECLTEPLDLECKEPQKSPCEVFSGAHRTAGGFCSKDSTLVNEESKSSTENESASEEFVAEAEQSTQLVLPELTLRCSEQIRDAISDAESSHILNLTGNNLSSSDLSALFDSLDQDLLKQIHTLEISNNQLAEPVDLSRLSELRIINAAFNQLSDFPLQWYQQLKTRKSIDHVSSLDLTGNPINRFDDLDCLDSEPEVTLILPNNPLLVITIKSSSSSLNSVYFSKEFPSAIIDNKLYLGDIRHLDLETLARLNIGTVFNCANDKDVVTRTSILRRQAHSPLIHDLKLSDDERQKLELPLLAKQIHDALELGQTVMVNCRQGVSRSATLIVAYLMLHKEFNLIEAVLHVKKSRDCIQPNPGFMRQLIDLELQLRPKTDEEALIEVLEQHFGLDVKIPNPLAPKTSQFDNIDLESSVSSSAST